MNTPIYYGLVELQSREEAGKNEWRSKLDKTRYAIDRCDGARKAAQAVLRRCGAGECWIRVRMNDDGRDKIRMRSKTF